MAEHLREPRAYELMTVFVPELSDEDGQAQLDTVSGYITSADGSIKEVLTDSPWGRRRLAYTIRFNGVDYRDGIYSVYHFDAAPSAIAQIERDLKLDTSTMRYLLVHDDPKAGEKYPQSEGEPADQEGAVPGDESQATEGSETAAATATEAQPEPEPEIATTDTGDPATTEAAAEDQPAETLTEDAVSAEDEPVTEPAPEQLDPESGQVPESLVVESEAEEAESEGDTSEDEGTDDVTDTGTESTDDETAKE